MDFTARNVKAKIVAIMLALSMAFSLFSMTASAAGNQGKGNSYPIVFVHGMMGWGSYESFHNVIDYWGLASGNMVNDLNGKYGKVYEASVGPVSSSWDRACELYAQLTGTRTDYGVAHSAKYGHERYGRDYTGKALIKNFNWNSSSKINLVGHSFGANTIRVFLDMLADGRSEEVAACKANGTKVSPLFKGGKGNYVHSITTIAGTNNGTGYDYAMPVAANASFLLYQIWMYGDSILGFPVLHDFQLDHFGLSNNSLNGAVNTLNAVLGSTFLSHHDNCCEETFVDRAVDMNKDLQIIPGVYYFCYGADVTKASSDGTRVSLPKAFPMLAVFSTVVGRYTGVTPGSYVDGYGSYQKTVNVTPTKIDSSWWRNDGFVNTVCEQTPFHYVNGKKVYDKHKTYVKGEALKPGQWYVMPTTAADHFGIIGGVFTEDSNTTRTFFRNLAQTIRSC